MVLGIADAEVNERARSNIETISILIFQTVHLVVNEFTIDIVLRSRIIGRIDDSELVGEQVVDGSESVVSINSIDGVSAISELSVFTINGKRLEYGTLIAGEGEDNLAAVSNFSAFGGNSSSFAIVDRDGNGAVFSGSDYLEEVVETETDSHVACSADGELVKSIGCFNTIGFHDNAKHFNTFGKSGNNIEFLEESYFSSYFLTLGIGNLERVSFGSGLNESAESLWMSSRASIVKRCAA